MGMFGDIFGAVGDGLNALGDYGNAKKDKSAAERAKRDYYGDVLARRRAAGYAKYDPTYQSDLVGPYQRTQSPAARAYLESMLTGDNSQAAAAPWNDQSAGAQERFNDRYGKYDKLLAEGEADRASTPWQTKTPGAVDKTPFTVIEREKQGWDTSPLDEHGRSKGWR